MRLMWTELIDEALAGERTSIMRDEVEVYTGQKPAVISGDKAVFADRRTASSVFGGNLLDQDGTLCLTKECQVQEGK